MNTKQKKVAIVLFNLGGPDSLDAVQPFLFNLFNDKHIITLPQPLRYLLAKFISRNRVNKAIKIYEKLGGKSPILEETMLQASVLEKFLNDSTSISDDTSLIIKEEIYYKTFVAMRYWHPMTEEVIEDVKLFNPEHVILLPLYPQYSTTTTLSSLKNWFNIAKKTWNNYPKTDVICCYYDNHYFINAYTELLIKTIKSIPITDNTSKIHVLFSAHGLPKKTIANGDPYQFQVETTVKKIIAQYNQYNICTIEYTICYQSKVGPLKWLEPDTESEIIKAAKNNKIIVIVPISFVSEHSETLVELDIDYKNLAESYGANFFRVPTVGINNAFIKGLASMCIDRINKISESKIIVNDGRQNGDSAKVCPNAMCCKKIKLI
jgi:ferrochelatase